MEATSKQLFLSTQSGRLKPDIRLGFAISEFAQVLDDDRKKDFRRMQTAGTQLCGRDAIRVTEELNRNSEQMHHAWQPYGTKCGKFLDRLQTLANIGDVAIGGSQNVIATSVWCAVRLSLQTATNFRGYFERLSSLFMRLGTSWELHHEFAQIFPQSKVLQIFLCEYLIVLMQLCRTAVIFSNKSLAGQLWSSLGASFESEFKPLQQKMDEWGLLIQQKTQQLATTHVVDAEMFRRSDYKQRILHLLSPNQDQHFTTWRRHRRKGECKWIYQTDSFKSWAAEDVSSTMCVSGKLGSGKTVTMANLVAHMNVQQTCAFFFCTFREQESLKARAVLGSIAFQLLDSLPADDSAWDVLSRQKDTKSRVLTSNGIIRLLTDVLPEDGRYVVAFDGLEDCFHDEITEVVSSLRRLMTRRVVLICFSARSGSTFQRLTAQNLSAKYSLSLAKKMHDDEIQAYITDEVARRRQTSQPGLFSDKLVELVEKQLLAGAHGMYLWVSLQLDTIFPSQPTTVVTYGQIVDLINNLPKDLPEAFERALETVIDDRYGDTIMKIVMAAQSPLTLDELKVALTVVPGDPVWYAAKVPTDSSQLIPLCGGNLLELDEEDGKVRFIHGSVVSHLLQAAKNPRTRMYHFTLQDAEVQLGAICVTFLNMPIFETAVTVTSKVDGAKFAEEVIGAATHERPLLRHLARLFKKADRHQTRSIEFDIGRLLAELQADRALEFDPHCFQEYAVSSWLTHSGAFHKEDPLCKKIWQLWVSLVCCDIEVARPPFGNPADEPWPALLWALEHDLKALVFAIFEEPTIAPTDVESMSQGVLRLEAHRANGYDRSSLGLILVHLLWLAVHPLVANHDIYGSPTYGSDKSSNVPHKPSRHLIHLGADLMVKHSKNGKTIIQMLLGTLGCISETTADGRNLCDFLMRVLVYEKTQPLLPSRSAWVRDALGGILERDNSRIFAKLLPYLTKPDLQAEGFSLASVAIVRGNVNAIRALLEAWPADVTGLGYTSDANDRPAIQLALEMQNKEMVALLSGLSLTSRPKGMNRYSAPLLKIALERTDVEEVELLLQLGANPNLGYQAIVEEPLPHEEFRYHLQITAERNQSLKFLTLLRYGADPSLPAFPNVCDIVRRHDNLVLQARLKEIDSSFEPTSLSRPLGVASRDASPPSSALLEVCKMLALDVDEDQALRRFGVVRSQSVGRQANKQELTLVLLSLAKTTHPARLMVPCSKGNTVLHYLTGGIPNFNPEALYAASHLLDSAPDFYTLLFQPNKYGQMPLHRAIHNGSRSSWKTPYIDSALFLLSRLREGNRSKLWLTKRGNDILALSLSKGAPVHLLIKALLDAKVDTEATLHGAAPLEIAVNMPDFHYASMATKCLLFYGADPSVKCSNGGSLMDVVPTKRRDWLQGLLQQPSAVKLGGWLETTEAYELEDPATTRQSIDANRQQLLSQWNVFESPVFIHTKDEAHLRSRPGPHNLSPAYSCTSMRAVCNGT